MKFLIAGGGTGGHVFTGIAVAREFLRRSESHQVFFVGTEKGLEKKLVPQEGFDLQTINVSGLKGVGWKKRAWALLHLFPSFVVALRILWREKPSVVLGVGGYASGPILLMSSILGLPSAIIEQNSVPGLANRILGRWVRRVFLAFPIARKYFPKEKCFQTGNPIREEMIRSKDGRVEREDGCLNVLIFGGSQGAEAIDRAVLDALPLLAAFKDRLRFHHQSSSRFREELKEVYAQHGFRAQVEPFIEDMGAAYGWSDLVVCRAGALSVSEIATLGKAAILVPYPHAADNHQEANARSLAEQGAAVMVLNQVFSGPRLTQVLQDFLGNPDEIRRLAQNVLRFSSARSAQTIVDSCMMMV